MARTSPPLASSKRRSVDPIWENVRREAEAAVASEPALGGFIFATILSHDRLEDAICHRLAQRLNHSDVDAGLIHQTFEQVLSDKPDLGNAFRADLAAVYDRDPACKRYIEPLLYFKGFHALVTHRFAHDCGRRAASTSRSICRARARASSRSTSTRRPRSAPASCSITAPASSIGETAEIGDNCSLLHGVTLGGTGKEEGDRHPKIGHSVMIGAGAKVLGNIRVGHCSRIAAGSVVLNDVPPNTTVAGVPAKAIGPAGCPEPARTMDQRLDPKDCGCTDC